MDSQAIDFGRYRLLKLLARGGMGEVYLAQYKGVAGFEKQCVIKKIRADLADQSSFTERFLNEGRTLVALTHSNIVQIFDMGEVDGSYYLAMEYVKGTDLRQILRRMGGLRMPVVCAVAVAREMLKGLGYAHRATDSAGKLLGIVHRDVSPSNVMISTEGEVKLIDFGIAKIQTMESSSGVVQGKFAYMSPEQARGDALDARTDLFSCGIVLYEMLSGVRPFEGDSDLRSLELVKTHIQRPLSAYRSDVSEALDKILDRVLAKDRTQRYETAEAFYDALEAVLAGQRFDQRDIANYFAPFMTDYAGTAGAIEDALDQMLNAQAFAQGRMTTRTLDVQAVTGSDDKSASEDVALGDTRSLPALEPIAEADVLAETKAAKAAGRSDVSALASGMAENAGAASSEALDAHGIATEASDNAAGTSSEVPEKTEGISSEVPEKTGPVSDVADASGNAAADNEQKAVGLLSGSTAKTGGASSEKESSSDSLALPEADGHGRRRRLSAKVRYGIAGGVIVMLVAIVLVAVIWHIDSIERASQFRMLLEAMRLGGDDGVEVRASGEAEAPSEDVFVPFWKRSIQLLEMQRPYRSGVPVLFRTDPESATLYIVEGGYRALDGKSVQLLTDRDVEIALQAPGYETCLFRVRFNGGGGEAFQNMDWVDCLGVSARLSADSHRIDVDVRLRPLRGRNGGADKDDDRVEAAMQDADAAAPEKAVAPEKNVQLADEGRGVVPEAAGDSMERAADSAGAELDSQAEADASSPALRTARENEKIRTKEKNSAREETRLPKTAQNKISSSVSASMASRLVAGELRVVLPAEVSLPEGTAFEIQPLVSGRKIAVPYRGRFGADSIRADFCEATVRIEESYVPGDPSPYQVADIYLNGRRVAAQASIVRLVAPCQAYEVEARTASSTARLRGSATVRFDSSASQTISLHLLAE